MSGLASLLEWMGAAPCPDSRCVVVGPGPAWQPDRFHFEVETNGALDAVCLGWRGRLLGQRKEGKMFPEMSLSDAFITG